MLAAKYMVQCYCYIGTLEQQGETLYVLECTAREDLTVLMTYDHTIDN